MIELARHGLSSSYSARPESVAVARRALSDFATAAGADPQQAEAVALASSEALTNAVVHAYRGESGQIHVTTAVVCDELWILIADDGCGLEPETDHPGLGLGLGLIARVTDSFAIVPRSSGGVEVRMRFDLAAAQLPAGLRTRATTQLSSSGLAPSRPPL